MKKEQQQIIKQQQKEIEELKLRVQQLEDQLRQFTGNRIPGVITRHHAGIEDVALKPNRGGGFRYI